MTTTEQARKIAEANEYLAVKVIDGKVYGLLRFIYTTGLVVDADEHSYSHRYCYPVYADAVEAFAQWDGKGDPPGNWIKRKGRDGEFSNPNYDKDGA